jgi:hypothetical protein
MGWAKGIIYRELNNKLEETADIGAILWTEDTAIPSKHVLPFWPGAAGGGGIFPQIL